MVDRLQRAVQILETLPPDVQQSVAEQVEQLASAVSPSGAVRRSHAGIWPDLPNDMEETLERWRHEVSPPSRLPYHSEEVLV